jgi:hypothetical protein
LSGVQCAPVECNGEDGQDSCGWCWHDRYGLVGTSKPPIQPAAAPTAA